jgi:hypothetical protein
MKVRSKKGRELHVPGEVGQLFIDAGLAELVPEPIKKHEPKTTWRVISDHADLQDAPMTKKPAFIVAAECASCNQKVWLKGPNPMEQKFFHCGVGELPPADLLKRGVIEPPNTSHVKPFPAPLEWVGS